MNTALAAVAFTPATNNDVNTTIAVNIADGLENGVVAVTGAIALNVTAVNDQLSATNTSQTKSYTEGAATVALDDIVVSDVDTGEIVTARLTLANTSAGVLTTNGTSTYSSGTGVWEVTGSVATVNTALAAVAFTPATNNDVNTTIAVNIADGLENGAVAVTGAIALNVTAVNDQLSATNTSQTKSYTEGAATVALDDIVVSDVDTGEIVTARLTLANTSAGVLTTNGTSTYSGGTGVWEVTGSVATVNTALAAVAFTPATNNDVNTTIAVNIADGLENGVVAVTGAIALNVTAVNDAPTAANNTVTTDEDTDKVFAVIDFNFSDVDTGASLSSVKITVTASDGTLYVDSNDSDTVGGGEAVNNNGVVPMAAISGGQLKFKPDPNANGASYATFSFQVSDGTVYSTAAYLMTIDVTAVNDQLSATNTSQTKSYTEGAATVALDDIVVSDVTQAKSSRRG